MKRPVRGVILDVDGTLVDSNPAHALAWFKALRQHGFDPGPADIRSHLGMGSDRFVQAVLSRPKGAPNAKELASEISQTKNEIFEREYRPTLQAFRRADEFVEFLVNEGIRVVIASSGGAEELERTLNTVGPAALAAPRISMDDLQVDASKPAPDIVEAALEKLALYPVETFMIGDSPYDVEAALRCGVRTIALRCGGFSDQALEGAVAIYDQIQDLLESFETSPLASAVLANPKQSRAG